VGKNADRSEVQFYMQNYRFLNTEECELNNFIKDKISKLDVIKPKIKAPKEKTKDKKVEVVVEKACNWGSNNW
jgi:hypothetical protein